jgi:hypothetical protein
MKSFLPILLSLFAASSAGWAADGSAELAVVVNKSRAPETADLEELRQMILGNRLKWRDGQNVVAVQTPADSPERVLMMKTVFKMNEAALKRYYMFAVFNGKDVVLPKDVASSAALKKFVASTPGAVGCILATEIDESVKVLKVDGAAPGEPGYKLR